MEKLRNVELSKPKAQAWILYYFDFLVVLRVNWTAYGLNEGQRSVNFTQECNFIN